VTSAATNQDDWDVLSFSTSYSDVSSASRASKDTVSSLARREKAKMFDEERNVLPLIVASPPPYLQASGGRYRVDIKRASLKQPFGLSFHVTQGADRRLSKIIIAEDFPQFGIQRFDEVVYLNQYSPKSIQECRSILQDALSLTLVLERRPKDGATGCLACPDPFGMTAYPSGASEAMRHVLAITKPRVLDHDKLEFTVNVLRCSLAQKFGIRFSTNRKHDKETEKEIEVPSSKGSARGATKKPQRSFWSSIRGKPSGPVATSEGSQQETKRGDKLDIKVGTSVPQMGLKRGDKLVSINGVVPKSRMKCLRIYQTSLVVKMVFRRTSARKLKKLKANVQEIDQEQQQVGCSLFPACF